MENTKARKWVELEEKRILAKLLQENDNDLGRELNKLEQETQQTI